MLISSCVQSFDRSSCKWGLRIALSTVLSLRPLLLITVATLAVSSLDQRCRAFAWVLPGCRVGGGQRQRHVQGRLRGRRRSAGGLPLHRRPPQDARHHGGHGPEGRRGGYGRLWVSEFRGLRFYTLLEHATANSLQTERLQTAGFMKCEFEMIRGIGLQALHADTRAS